VSGGGCKKWRCLGREGGTLKKFAGLAPRGADLNPIYGWIFTDCKVHILPSVIKINNILTVCKQIGLICNKRGFKEMITGKKRPFFTSKDGFMALFLTFWWNFFTDR